MFERSGTGDAWPAGSHDGDPVSVGVIAAGGSAKAGPIPWRPQTTTARVLAVAAADDDPSILESIAGSASIARLVAVDNNLGHRAWGTLIG